MSFNEKPFYLSLVPTKNSALKIFALEFGSPRILVEDIEPVPTPQPSNEPQKAKRAPLLAPQNSQSNIMTTSGRPQSANPYHQLSRPASNVFIDTVNSLEDITTKKKIKARNSSEKLASTLGSRCENVSKRYVFGRTFGSKAIDDY